MSKSKSAAFNKTADLSEAYECGQGAREQGLGLHENPYSCFNDKYNEWENGWNAGAGRTRRKKAPAAAPAHGLKP